jgi:hypothetical protein
MSHGIENPYEAADEHPPEVARIIRQHYSRLTWGYSSAQWGPGRTGGPSLRIGLSALLALIGLVLLALAVAATGGERVAAVAAGLFFLVDAWWVLRRSAL